MAIKSISCDPNQAIRMTFHDSVVVVFEDTKDKSRSVFPLPLANIKRIRPSCGSLTAQNNELTLLDRGDDIYVTLSAQDGLGAVSLSVCTGGQPAAHDLENVQKMTISGSKIMVFTQSAAAHAQPSVSPPVAFSPLVNPVRPQQPAAVYTEQANEDLKASIIALRQENERLSAEKKSMEYALGRVLGEQIDAGTENCRALSKTLQEKLDAFARVQAEEQRITGEISQTGIRIREAEHRRDTAQEKHRNLQAQLAQLRPQAEATELDCGAVSRELEELRIRLNMNGNVIELSESRWLKNNSVRETMEELEQKIRAVEERIRVIINARETYNRTVQAAIMRENDGTISADAETGITGREAAEPGGADLR